MNEYYRPAEHQIDNVYRCDKCSNEIVTQYSASNCLCGGNFILCGESYPADSSEWEEQRDPDGVWRERRY